MGVLLMVYDTEQCVVYRRLCMFADASCLG